MITGTIATDYCYVGIFVPGYEYVKVYAVGINTVIITKGRL